ncbi:4157_t:CDS:2 [Diversispora eburnea]|uniref:4157_t:CDS:1 n=1 Tax=Diversispora eburnea TaxID=1213867 RepID=A0A9N8V1A4_9GLOM|nr:4157_t:CDS:2 [Diversispora eburnea]
MTFSRLFAFPIQQVITAPSNLIKPYLQQFQVQRVGYVTRLWTRGNEKPPPKKPRNKTARYRAMLKVISLECTCI